MEKYFQYPFGHFEYLVMSFGLTDTHAVLQAIVNVKKKKNPLQLFALHSDLLEMQKEPVQHVCLVLQCVLEKKYLSKLRSVTSTLLLLPS